MLSKIRNQLNEICTALESLETSMNYLDTTSETSVPFKPGSETSETSDLSEKRKVYVGLHSIDVLEQLRDVQGTLEDLQIELKLTDTTEETLDAKILEKQEAMTKDVEFKKTFGPLMMLYQMGYIRRNWE